MRRAIHRPPSLLVFLLFLISFQAAAITRWSANHIIPDADFIQSWNYVLQYEGYYYTSEAEGSILRNAGFARMGISEWADLQAGYVDGITLGLKAKVLGETSRSMPSLAVGVHNVLNHKEDYYFNHDSAIWSNEFFIVAGKSIEPLKLRLHFGIETMPNRQAEMLDYFFGLEKFLGGSAYISLETFYRDKKLRPSLFASVRFLKKHVEISAGAVDLVGMFLNKETDIGTTAAAQPKSLVKPGFTFSVRFLGDFGSGSRYGGFGSIEEQLAYQKEMIKLLRRDVDSVRRVLMGYEVRIDSLTRNFTLIADSALGTTTGARLRDFAMERLIKLNTLYGQENMDAERIKSLAKEIVSYGDVMAPTLKEIALDNKLERKVHVQAMTRLGQIGSRQAADAIIDILAQTQDPDVKIEGLIALGVMKDRRASYLIEQLASDPNDAVSFTATEVLQKLENRLPDKKDTSAAGAPPLPKAIPESRIGGKGAADVEKKQDSPARTAVRDSASAQKPEQAQSPSSPAKPRKVAPPLKPIPADSPKKTGK